MQTRSRSIFHIFILLTLFAVLPMRQVFAAPSFTVDSILDEIDDNTSDGICHSASNHCTLRAAVMQANKMTGSDVTINLPAGTYTLTRPAAGADGDDNGDLNLTAPVTVGQVITIIGAGANTTIIDANQIDRVIYMHNKRNAFISGVTVRNGYTAVQGGGGIYNEGALTVTNSTLSGNSATYGGGIYDATSGTLTLTNTTLSGNSAINDGGGLYNNGTLTVNNSTISGNQSGNQGGDGGGIFNNGTLTVSNSTISGNQSGDLGGDGGGIFSNTTLTVSNSSISGNHADFGYGGGIFNNFSGTLTVTNSTISGNSARDGGGGILNSNSLIVVNSTLSHNSANRDGGGIYNSNLGAANLYNTTISFNGADADPDPYRGSGGGVFNYPGYTFNLINALVAGNYQQNTLEYDDCSGTLNSYGGNLFWMVNAGCTINNTSGSNWAYLNSLDLIGPLQNNGGPTFTHALLLGSNAINGADPTLGCIDSGYVQLPTDQRGVARPQGAWCDIGAYEFNDYVPPSVSSIVRASANPSSAASVDFTVTFSESVAGVNTSDFGLTTTGVSSAAVSGVSGSGSSYTVTVNTGSGNGTIRLDVVNDGTIKDAALNPLAAGFTNGEIYTVIKSATFGDVPLSYWADSYIERLFNAGITGGCGTGIYCPDTAVTRAQMAVFLLKGMHGSSYTPPAVGVSTGFNDVATDYWAAAWIKQLAAEGITGGCGSGNYCPDVTVTRAQMAIFLLKAEHGSFYSPPAATGVFTDVPVSYWAAAWIERLASEGITGGCGAGVYCPDAEVTRAQMAVFLVKAFNLP